MFKKRKSRFSLLQLEVGEYYLQDFSVYHVPLPRTASTNPHVVQSRMGRPFKGRLKVCTHSLIFEPFEVRRPIVKFKFKHFLREPQIATEISFLEDHDVAKSFLVEVDTVVEMKANNENCPYKKIKCGDESKEDDGKSAPPLHIFTLVHTPVREILSEIKKLLRLSKDEKSIVMEIEQRQNVEFDISYLSDYSERVQLERECLVDRVSPLVNNPGCLQVTNKSVYFQPARINNVQKDPVSRFSLKNIQKVYKRRYMLRQCGLELIMSNGNSVFFAFKNTVERDVVFTKVITQPELSQVERCDPMFMQEMTRKWQAREIDNFTYLMHLNSVADRSVNDLTQYPVMPWVLCDFKSEELNLEDPKVFRDLTKPIGALEPKRLKTFLQRYEQMPTGKGFPPRFMYGTHYSTPGYVLNYLVRDRPEYMLCLQNGRFDHADRIFTDIQATWDSVIRNPADVKELIPEFYEGNGDFLLNTQRLQLGTRQDGLKVDDVILPPWAKDSRDFVTKCREAMESEYVSKHINHWIDLIFGYKQRGMEAEKAHNVFYHITYEGAVDVDSIKDPVERNSIMLQIREFGQTPKQIFFRPHPERDVSSSPSIVDSTRSSTSRKMPSGVVGLVGGSSSNRIRVRTLSALSSTARLDDEDDKGDEEEKLNVKDEFDDDTNISFLISKFNNNKKRITWYDSVHFKSVTGVCVGKSCQRGEFYSTSEDAGLGLLRRSRDRKEEDEMKVTRGISKLALSSVASLSPKNILASSWDGNLYVWSTSSRTTLNEIRAHEDAVSCVCTFGKHILSGSWDTSVKLWNVSNEGVIGGDLIFEHDTEVSRISMCSASTVLTGSCDGEIYLHDIRTKAKAVLCFELGVASVTHLSGGLNGGSSFVTCGADGMIRVVSLRTSKAITEFPSGEEDIRCACLANGRLVTSGRSGDDVTSSSSLSLWDLNGSTRKIGHFYLKDRRVVNDICCDGNGLLYAGCDDGSTMLL